MSSVGRGLMANTVSVFDNPIGLILEKREPACCASERISEIAPVVRKAGVVRSHQNSGERGSSWRNMTAGAKKERVYWYRRSFVAAERKEGSAMKYGLDVSITGAYAHAGLLADLAVLAEEAGWDGFFVQDGVLNADGQALVDPWIALAAIAQRTHLCWLLGSSVLA